MVLLLFYCHIISAIWRRNTEPKMRLFAHAVTKVKIVYWCHRKEIV